MSGSGAPQGARGWALRPRGRGARDHPDRPCRFLLRRPRWSRTRARMNGDPWPAGEGRELAPKDVSSCAGPRQGLCACRGFAGGVRAGKVLDSCATDLQSRVGGHGADSYSPLPRCGALRRWPARRTPFGGRPEVPRLRAIPRHHGSEPHRHASRGAGGAGSPQFRGHAARRDRDPAERPADHPPAGQGLGLGIPLARNRDYPDIPVLAQLRPGQDLRLAQVDVAIGREARREIEKRLLPPLLPVR